MVKNAPETQTRRQASVDGLTAADLAELQDQLELEVYDYMDHELFSEPAARAEKLIFREAEDIPEPDVQWYNPLIEDVLGVHARAVTTGTILLTAKQEQALFLQFNYARCRASRLHDRLRRQRKLNAGMARKFLDWHRKAESYRDQIANTNLGLVLAMAKRTRATDLEFGDMVSEGNMALMRAIDKFDASRGFKFSTYACRAILKAFSRAGQKQTRHRRLFPAEYDPKFEKSDFSERQRADHEEACVDEVSDIVRSNRAELSEVEIAVLDHRFGLREETRKPNGRGFTLEQVGRTIGVTKERVRQIQNRALEKIRHHLETEFLN
ncbi:sigma-70 family RNA polymerase sigma factor [Mucisphaera sp.]|uniref:sigma-70 family RNA polymerase sigma factor n=1 Tax=Mucisphaera sp. TaxID=2913024 RepID=UPI003D10B1C7